MGKSGIKKMNKKESTDIRCYLFIYVSEITAIQCIYLHRYIVFIHKYIDQQIDKYTQYRCRYINT